MSSEYLNQRFKVLFKSFQISPLKDPAFSTLRNLNSESNLTKLENFEWNLERVTFKFLMKSVRNLGSATPKELKTYLIDYLIINQMTALLKELTLKSLGQILELLNEISDSEISKGVENELAWNYIPLILSQEESVSVIETLSKYFKLFLSQDAKDFLKTIIHNAGSDKLDDTENDARKVAEGLISLKEASIVDYDITKYHANLYFQLLDINKLIYSHQIEWFPQPRLSDEEVFQSLFTLRNFSFSQEHKILYEKWNQEVEQVIKSVKKKSLDEIKVYTYYVNRVINNPEELIDADIGKSLEVQDLAMISFNKKNLIYKSENNRFDTKIYKANWGEKEVAVKLFYCNDKNKLAKFLQNQAFIMHLMSDDKNFLKLFGAFKTYLPEELKDCNMQNSSLVHGCLVMEYFSMSLRDFIKSLENNSTDSFNRQIIAKKIGWKLIKSMKRLNDKGIKHKDIKPSNILIKKEGEKFIIKVIDFDVSTFKQKNSEFTEEATTQVVGTKKYMAPEVLKLFKSNARTGKYNANRADVYSLGLVMLEIAVSGDFINNHEAFLANNLGNDEDLKGFQRFIVEIINNKVFEEELKDVLLNMLEVDPQKRPAFRDLVRSLQSHLENTFKTFEDINDEDYQNID